MFIRIIRIIGGESKMKSQTSNSNQPYESDASQIKGTATEVIQPTTIAEVKRAVQLHQHICIRGGGSGLVGGCVPQNEVVLDLSKLDKIGEIDLDRRTIEVGTGVILGDLQNYLERYGLEFPVNPSSSSIATIGGMVATDAVGNRAVKYGRTSDWVNWLNIVNAKGESIKKSKTELSDYAGMEGITGVIVEASLKLVSKKDRTADFIEDENLSVILEKVLQTKRDVDVSMVEFLDKMTSKIIGLEEKYHLIIEYESDKGTFKGKEYRDLLQKRFSIGPLISREGYTISEDPKVMLAKSEELILWFEQKKIPVFGHLSIGIFHPRFKENQKDLISEMINLVKKMRGKISGEHGIGLVKKEFVDINDRKILLNVKKRTDPKNKFNQGKIL